jgi:hypothetical protein
VTKDVSNNVSAWRDMTGAAFATSTATHYPVWTDAIANGLPVLRQASALLGMVCSVAVGAAFTLSLVATKSGAAPKYLCAGTSAASMAIIYGFTANLFEWYSNGGTDRFSFDTVTDAAFHTLTLTQNASKAQAYLDGVAKGSKNSPGAGSNLSVIGNVSASYTQGASNDTAAVILMPSVLGTADLALLQRFEKARYGTA